eukprot:CAMPEP_0114537992 /NCGR_PEP_ID=MMETSP0109-20121206/29888_1 /TAXON_ID=29199 /ORGANISM="Chlorarachnion reptans, Strain CCCM449" /LENGTH=182 /DNA_ID=CAMNT_0001721947 /DNA_START=57 /DNA_END=603 /DNA_ORIENTATION=-
MVYANGDLYSRWVRDWQDGVGYDLDVGPSRTERGDDEPPEVETRITALHFTRTEFLGTGSVEDTRTHKCKPCLITTEDSPSKGDRAPLPFQQKGEPDSSRLLIQAWLLTPRDIDRREKALMIQLHLEDTEPYLDSVIQGVKHVVETGNDVSEDQFGVHCKMSSEQARNYAGCQPLEVAVRKI